MPSKVGLVRVEEKKKEDRKEDTPKKSESNGKPTSINLVCTTRFWNNLHQELL
jgi:hypothetical protein